MPPFEIDGNWVDLASVVVAALFAVVKHQFNGGATRFISKRTGYAFATGTSLFPIFMLGMSIFSSAILESLLDANKLTLSVAGFIALFSILEDEFEKETKRAKRPK